MMTKLFDVKQTKQEKNHPHFLAQRARKTRQDKNYHHTITLTKQS